MPGSVNLRLEISDEDRRLMAAQMRVWEEFSRRLLEFLHPLESSLVRRQPLSQADAEWLQRIVARLRSRVSQAVWDLGLPRTNQDSRQELACLAAKMEGSVQELVRLGDRSGIPAALAEYLVQLQEELGRIVGDIDRAAGKSAPNAVAVS